MPQRIEANVVIAIPSEKVIVDKSYLRDLEEQTLTGKTWSLTQFRENCCGNRGVDWVKLFIFSEFKDEIEVDGSKGWLVNSHTPGRSIIIFADKACKWMSENNYRIDWEAKLP